ncbi:cupin fold metalloprotein, WbuC family [Saccharobesus litoralis]|uniref:Cupin fold metalloprotein, WbuC family n=1 Tax=Saccharobesus litoralis TaxID=2172099 RepID=A0A2S0VUY7_9ALTE|nr:WbuC family cupin fold metalloprotein [Saccharobesus litoralis]AWB68036.1 cupin fold metalloprotein, WbuC family [Saccharobesus litoralis]
MKNFDQRFFDQLVERAKASPRRRTNENLHDDYNAPVQRLFIAMEPDSYVRPHRHIESNKWEFFYVSQGRLLFLLYDEQGTVTKKVELSANGPQQGLEIPPNVWHSTVALESGTVFFEVKEGPYTVTTDKGFAQWAPVEGDPEVADFIAKLVNIQEGESARF